MTLDYFNANMVKVKMKDFTVVMVENFLNVLGHCVKMWATGSLFTSRSDGRSIPLGEE